MNENLRITFESYIKTANEITFESYIKTTSEYCSKTQTLLLTRQLDEFLSHVPSNATILDAGCAGGRDAKYFSEKGHKVIGIDMNFRFLEIARDQAPKAKFMTMDIGNLLFQNETFNGIWAAASYLHLPKVEFPNALQKCYDVLAPNGVMYLSFKRGQGEKLESDERYGGVKKFFAYYEDSELREIVGKTNFSILSGATVKGNSEYSTHPWIEMLLKK